MRWVIGDIHGMLTPLQALMVRVREVDPSPRWYFVGDYVNRGPDSKGVIDLLLSLPDARFVRGNHDDIFDMILNGTCFAIHPHSSDAVRAFQWFMSHGMGDTLTSYGVDWADIEFVWHHPTALGVNKLFQPVPEAHRAFIRGLPPVVLEPDIFIAHAMWGPDDLDTDAVFASRLSFDMAARHKVLWGRFGIDVGRTKRWRRTGYFGHTPIEMFPESLTGGRNEPLRAHHVVLLDTAAALSRAGRLTAVCADNGQAIQVDRVGALVIAGVREKATKWP